MDASGQNYKDTFRYTDVEYTPDGHTDVYRWDDFLGIAGGTIGAVGKAPSVSEGAFFRFRGRGDVMRGARRSRSRSQVSFSNLSSETSLRPSSSLSSWISVSDVSD